MQEYFKRLLRRELDASLVGNGKTMNAVGNTIFYGPSYEKHLCK